MHRPATLLASLAFALTASTAGAQSAEPSALLTVKAARATLAGNWRAELQYRDYQSDRWIGIPYSATIALVDDGVTLVRTSAYDEGRSRGTVYITTVSMLAPDGATEYTGTFRAGRPAEMETTRLTLTAATDAAHWTIVSTQDGTDDDRPASIRETVVRAGDTVTSTKEVDFKDDAKAEWLMRNRTVLTKAVP